MKFDREIILDFCRWQIFVIDRIVEDYAMK